TGTFHPVLARLHVTRATILLAQRGGADAALREAQKAAAYLDLVGDRPADDAAMTTAADVTLAVDPRRDLPAAGTAAAAPRLRFPVAFWLRSRQDRGLKTAAATATLLAIVAAGVGAVELHGRWARDAAHAALLAAVARDDSSAALAAAEAFIMQRPLVGT